MKHTQTRLFLHRYNTCWNLQENSHHRQYKEENTGNVILNTKKSLYYKIKLVHTNCTVCHVQMSENELDIC